MTLKKYNIIGVGKSSILTRYIKDNHDLSI